MVFMLICYVGIAVVAVMFAVWFSRGRTNEDGEVRPPVIPVEPERPYWQNNPNASALATDDIEYQDMLARYQARPNDFPAPIPPPVSFNQHHDCAD
jgi:hypothetical protein